MQRENKETHTHRELLLKTKLKNKEKYQFQALMIFPMWHRYFNICVFKEHSWWWYAIIRELTCKMGNAELLGFDELTFSVLKISMNQVTTAVIMVVIMVIIEN